MDGSDYLDPIPCPDEWANDFLRGIEEASKNLEEYIAECAEGFDSGSIADVDSLDPGFIVDPDGLDPGFAVDAGSIDADFIADAESFDIPL